MTSYDPDRTARRTLANALRYSNLDISPRMWMTSTSCPASWIDWTWLPTKEPCDGRSGVGNMLVTTRIFMRPLRFCRIVAPPRDTAHLTDPHARNGERIRTAGDRPAPRCHGRAVTGGPAVRHDGRVEIAGDGASIRIGDQGHIAIKRLNETRAGPAQLQLPFLVVDIGKNGVAERMRPEPDPAGLHFAHLRNIQHPRRGGPRIEAFCKTIQQRLTFRTRAKIENTGNRIERGLGPRLGADTEHLVDQRRRGAL